MWSMREEGRAEGPSAAAPGSGSRGIRHPNLRALPELGAPRLRSRKDRRQSIRFTKAARFRVLGNGRLRLPGIGDVAVRWSRKLPSKPSSVTVTVDAAGRYHASFVVQAPEGPLRVVGQETGIDLGLTRFAVLSDDTSPPHGSRARPRRPTTGT